MNITDSHLHLSDLSQNDFSFIDDIFSVDGVDKYLFCTSSHSLSDYNMTCQLIKNIYSKYDISNVKICHSLGIHPQNPDINMTSLLENVLKSEKYDIKPDIKYDKLSTKYDILQDKYDKNMTNLSKYDINYDKISAIGECGFDLFTPEFKSTLDKQKEVWNYQLELAIKYDKPIIVHCRKGMCHIFESIEKLKKIKAVIFHSFSGSMVEAQSILKKGINGFFSFGKPILNGNKNAIQCVKSLPLENILLETDSPYQTLKGEEVTNPSDVLKVYKEVFNLRQEDSEVIVSKVFHNFDKIFNHSIT
jgi:TatD family hydrolase